MKNIFISIKITLVFCVILGVGYVSLLWGVALIATPNHGQADVLTSNGKVVAVKNVGQSFTSDHYFWERPSVVDYNGSGSGGSNKSVSNPDYLKEVSTRIDSFLSKHPYLERSEVPSEMVTASGSGLDPHISVDAAMVQVERVATARGITTEELKGIVTKNTERYLAGPLVINVVKLNIALDNNK